MDGAGPTGIAVITGIVTTGTAGIGTTATTIGAGSTDASANVPYRLAAGAYALAVALFKPARAARDG